MLLKRTYFFLVNLINRRFANNIEINLQTEDLTSVDSKKFFEGCFREELNTPDSSIFVYERLSIMNTVFYILYEWKRNKIDTNKILFRSQENKQNMPKIFELMFKLKQEDLEELIKLNNEIMGNFLK